MPREDARWMDDFEKAMERFTGKPYGKTKTKEFNAFFRTKEGKQYRHLFNR